MNRKPTFAEKFRDFIDGKGFYVVVLVCVAAIGISGFYLLWSMDGGDVTEPGAPVSGTASVTVSPSPSPSPTAPASLPAPSNSPAAVSPSPGPSPSAPAGAQTPAPAESDPAQESPSTPPVIEGRPTALVFNWPVRGTILADFSLETLAYDETMGDWRTHSGIDIAAPQGTDVVTVADGTVTEVRADGLMGTTVVIDHGQGMQSVYSNLDSLLTVEEGDQVTTGSILGVIGSTAIAESGRDSHLHFELYEDGMAVDPEQYLPENP